MDEALNLNSSTGQICSPPTIFKQICLYILPLPPPKIPALIPTPSPPPPPPPKKKKKKKKKKKN